MHMSRRPSKDEPIRYVVATHSWMEGARLSKCGHWGNMPHPDVEAATAAARYDRIWEALKRRADPRTPPAHR